MSRDDCDRLLNDAIDFAKQQLGKRGEFAPFGMTVQSDGEERMLGSLSDNPTTDELLGLLYAGLREKAEAGKLRTLVICTDGYSTDATTGARTDAILVRIEDEEQRPVTCILPYKKRTGLFGRGYEYGELIAAPLEPQVFVRE